MSISAGHQYRQLERLAAAEPGCLVFHRLIYDGDTDAGKLQALAASHPGLEYRMASVDDPASLDRALKGAAAVINCAGPFASTAAPVIEAALRTGLPYADVAAEIEANLDTFRHFTDRA